MFTVDSRTPLGAGLLLAACGLGLAIAGCNQRLVPEGWRSPCRGNEDCEPGLFCGVYPLEAHDSDAQTSCNIPCDEDKDCPNARLTGKWRCTDGACRETFPK